MDYTEWLSQQINNAVRGIRNLKKEQELAERIERLLEERKNNFQEAKGNVFDENKKQELIEKIRQRLKELEEKKQARLERGRIIYNRIQEQRKNRGRKPKDIKVSGG